MQNKENYKNNNNNNNNNNYYYYYYYYYNFQIVHEIYHWK